MDGVTRVFNPRRGRAHLISVTTSTTTYCGIWPTPDWLGLVSTDDVDEGLRRRLCERCYRRAMWRAT